MEAGLKRLVGAIELSKTRRTRVVAFTDSLSLLMALGAVPAVVEDAMLRRIWDLILGIVRLRMYVNFQSVFSHRGVPRNEAGDKAAERGNAGTQSYPAWVADVATGVERQMRNEVHRPFEEGRMPRTHRSALLGHVRPAPKHSKLDALNRKEAGAGLGEQVGTMAAHPWCEKALGHETCETTSRKQMERKDAAARQRKKWPLEPQAVGDGAHNEAKKPSLGPTHEN
ncbi:hypothetical protein ERJ75_000168900 [Trypanosoma vivax]|nr:hypothetical protein ERJ75_000168900 [Trypanosoma vivax]